MFVLHAMDETTFVNSHVLYVAIFIWCYLFTPSRVNATKPPTFPSTTNSAGINEHHLQFELTLRVQILPTQLSL